MGSLLQVRNLAVRYRSCDSRPHQAVDGVSFDIATGEIVGLMGESGCGKSSVALALLGLLPKENTEISGAILFQGHDLRPMDERELQKIRGLQISLVFQEPGIALSPVMRAGDQVAEVIHAHQDWNWKRCRMEAKRMLERVGFDDISRIYAAYPHQMSGGQRQRVVLAQALACNPALLVADEPTASLDARSQADFLALLRSLKIQSNISILLISHTPEIQANLADRLIVMKEGCILEEGSFEEICRNPSSDYTRRMLRRAFRTRDVRHDAFVPETVAEEQPVR